LFLPQAPVLLGIEREKKGGSQGAENLLISIPDLEGRFYPVGLKEENMKKKGGLPRRLQPPREGKFFVVRRRGEGSPRKRSMSSAPRGTIASILGSRGGEGTGPREEKADPPLSKASFFGRGEKSSEKRRCDFLALTFFRKKKIGTKGGGGSLAPTAKGITPFHHQKVKGAALLLPRVGKEKVKEGKGDVVYYRTLRHTLQEGERWGKKGM